LDPVDHIVNGIWIARQDPVQSRTTKESSSTSEERSVVYPHNEAAWIYPIDWIIVHITEEIRLPRLKPYRILADPPPHARIIIPRPKSHQPRILIVNPSRKPERHPIEPRPRH